MYCFWLNTQHNLHYNDWTNSKALFWNCSFDLTLLKVFQHMLTYTCIMHLNIRWLRITMVCPCTMLSEVSDNPGALCFFWKPHLSRCINNNVRDHPIDQNTASQVRPIYSAPQLGPTPTFLTPPLWQTASMASSSPSTCPVHLIGYLGHIHVYLLWLESDVTSGNGHVVVLKRTPEVVR